MGASFTSQSVERVRAQKRKSRWYKIIACLAAVVVFCTTYALILPAITKEQPVYCGYIDQHTDECYEEVRTLTCTIPEGGHVHTDKCYKTTKTLSCTLTEGEGHTHSDACYETIQTLVCTDPEHAHDESCYTESRVLICGMEEAAPHHHSDSCYTEEKTLACGFEEADAHTHTDECYTIEKKLICDHKVHEHTLQCYSDPEADVETRETWERTVERVELTDDWNADVLAIAKTQLGYHESERNYEVQANGVSMKGYTRYGAWYGIPYGDWCAMFCSFCLNYAEVDPKLMPRDANCPHWIRTLSSEDFDLYHPAYKFVERLEEKGIEQLKVDAEEAEKQEADEEVVENEEVPEQTDEEVPEDKEADEETTEDEEEKEDTYIPRPGDLIFFDWNSYSRQSDRESDHIGFVAELIYEEVPNEDDKPDEDGKKTHEELTKIRTIEGNSANQVRYVTYDIDDDRILGYGEIPEKPKEDEEEELLNVPSILSSWLGGSMRLMVANGPAPTCNGTTTTTINFNNENNDGGKFSILNWRNATRSNGLVTTSTNGGFDVTGPNATNSPEDVISIPVPSGDWTATLSLTFDQNGSQGWYEFFGFYAAKGDDYRNLVGIRGGDNNMQDFLRQNGNNTVETKGTTQGTGLKSGSNHYFRIVKSGTTYTCYWSKNGTNSFNQIFSFNNTNIDADRLIIDAYSGQVTGYKYTLKTLDITSTGGEHSYQTVSSTPATCTSAGSATYRCSKCNDQYTETIPALGHDYDADGVCTRCPARTDNKQTYYRHPISKVSDLIGKTFVVACLNDDYPKSPGALNDKDYRNNETGGDGTGVGRSAIQIPTMSTNAGTIYGYELTQWTFTDGGNGTVKLQRLDGSKYLVLDSYGVRTTTVASEATAFNVTIKNDGSFRLSTSYGYINSSGHAPNYNFFIKYREGDDLWAYGIEPYVPPAPEETRSWASGIFAKHNVYSVDDMVGVYAIAVTNIDYKTPSAMLATLNNGELGATVVETGTTSANNAPMFRANSPVTLWKIERVDAKHVRLRQNGNNGQYLVMNSSGNSFSLTGNASQATSFLVDVMNNGSVMLKLDNGGYVNAKGYNGEGYFRYQSGDALTLYTPTSITGNGPTVWLDGTNGGLMNLFGSPNINYSDHLTNNNNGTYSLVLPLTWTSPTKYEYRLFGWYDIYNHKYYAPGETVTVTGNTVFYADWRAASYDVGQYNEHVIPDVTTENFVRTQVFDYGVLFNTLSESITSDSTITALGHRDNWSRTNSGINPATGQNTLDFHFIDYNMEGHMLDKPGMANNVNEDPNNTSHYTAAQQGILGISNYEKFDRQRTYMVNGKNRTLLDMLFNPDSDFDPDSQQGVIGVSYIGEGDQFYHYMELGDSNYDGVHDGYYYYDSKLNAASYNQSEQRFFVYDYLETTDSPDHYSDFLPFNSLYANNNGRRVNQVDTKNGMPVYSYDATDYQTPRGQEHATDHAIANYFFGLRTDISFYLPNPSGYTEVIDGETIRGNQSTRGKDMEFYFSGDDDVWVFVDDELILDIGGMHGVLTGRINFSTGAWAVYNKNENSNQEYAVSSGTKTFQPGEHILTIYYMERGSSQSNCAIYYNLAPRYGFELKKQDGFTGEYLDGVEFEVYENEQLTDPAELWPNEAAYRGYIDNSSTNRPTNKVTVIDGVASCWGLAAGKTYYLKEVKTPDGYKTPQDIIRVRLNARGKATYETKIIDKDDNNETDITAPAFDVDDYTKSIDLTAYNQQDDSFSFTVIKKWYDKYGNEETAAQAATHPPITVELQYKLPGQDDGTSFENFGITVPLGVLSSENNWTYTWYGIPKVLHAKKTPWGGSGDIPLEGNLWAKETPVAVGYTVEAEPNEPTVVPTTRWAKVSQVTNGKTYILYNEDIQQALKPIGDYTFSGLSLNDAKEDTSAQWVAGYDSSTGKFTLKNASPPTAGRGYLNLWPSQSCAFVWSTAYQSGSYGAYFQYENGKLYSDDTATYLGQFRPNHTNYNLGLASNSSDAANIALYEYQVVQETVPPADNSYDFKLANYPIPDEDYTRIEVTKRWVDENGNEMDPFECDLPPVTIRLTSRFGTADTARKIVLSKENSYWGSFEKLPDLGSNDAYGLVEETDLDNYVVEGTSTVDGELVQSITIDVEEWEILNSGGGVNASSLALNGIYRFHNGDEALSAEPGTTRVFMARTDDNDLFQRWKVTAIQGSQIKLRNLGTLMYLSYGKEGAWTCTTSTSSDKWINLNGGKLNWNVADGTHVGLDNNQSGKVFPQVYDDCSVYKISHLTTREVHDLSKQSFTVTNKRLPSIEISVFKKWSDGYAAHTDDSVTVHLLWKDRGASDETYVDTGKSLTLSRENGWTGTFTDLLEYTQDFYGAVEHYKDYKVVEDDFPGYAPSFQITTDEATGDQDIVITNGPPGYELPETGGAGTTIFYALGGAMMLLAIMCGFSMRRKRERGSTR